MPCSLKAAPGDQASEIALQIRCISHTTGRASSRWCLARSSPPTPQNVAQTHLELQTRPSSLFKLNRPFFKSYLRSFRARTACSAYTPKQAYVEDGSSAIATELSLRATNKKVARSFTDQSFDAHRHRGLLVFCCENPYFPVFARCPFAPAGSFPKTSPVEWNRVMLTRDTLWRGKWRQALLSGSMGRRVLALFSPTMAETMCSFTSAPSNARDFPAWLKC